MHAVPLAGVEGPVEAVLRLEGSPGLTWLDGNGAVPDGRWSFVGADPIAHVEAEAGNQDPFRVLELATGRDPPHDSPGAPTPAEVPRWVGWIAYDALAAVRPTQRGLASRRVVSFARYDAFAAFDHVAGAAWIVGDDSRACARLAARLHGVGIARVPGARVHGLVAPDPAQHLDAIVTALGHIERGDIYQVNLARCWSGSLAGAPLALFLAMRRASSVPLGFFLQDEDRAVLSRTMERFLRWDVERGELVTRPIKGTVPRTGTDDASESRALRADPKERAEHAMIVDLMRNDLGRVAQVGTVQLTELMRVEPYAGLHHLVSTIGCRTAPGVTASRILEATFPPGSVTGTPKHRAMQIIAALEPRARDVFTGAVGFVDRAGGLSLAVAIRTAVVDDHEVRYWAGGGIVAASDARRELAETELKARAFLDAVRMLALDGERILSHAGISR